MKTAKRLILVTLLLLAVLLSGCTEEEITTCTVPGKTKVFEGQLHPDQPAYQCGNDGKFHPVQSAKVAEVVPTVKAPQADQLMEIKLCDSWVAGETKELKPGQSVLGDVVVEKWPGYDDLAAYDVGGVGEGSIIINNSQYDAIIFSQWGAGCKISTDTTRLVHDEFVSGCDDDGCLATKVYLLEDDGTSVKKFFRDQ